MLTQQIIDDFRLTLNAEGKVYVYFRSQGEVDFFPLPPLAECTLLTQEDFMSILNDEDNILNILYSKYVS